MSRSLSVRVHSIPWEINEFRILCCATGIIMSDGESWKEQRRFLLSTLKDFGIGKTSFQDVITDKSYNLLRTLEQQQGRPVDVRMMLNTAVSDVVSTVLFGQDYKHAETDFARYVDHVANAASELGGSALMNYWIWLRYLPYYSGIYHRLTRGMNFTFDVLRAIIENEKKSNPDNIVNNYIAAYFAKRKDTQSARFTDHNLMLTLSDIFGAGFETTGTTLRWVCSSPYEVVIGNETVGLPANDRAKIVLSGGARLRWYLLKACANCDSVLGAFICRRLGLLNDCFAGVAVHVRISGASEKTAGGN